jgi:hypothetical protein
MANAKNGARGRDLPGGDPSPLLPVHEGVNAGYGANADDIQRGYLRIKADGGGDPRIGPWPYHDRDGVIYVRSTGRDGI